jgi:hypothetical protein
MRSKPVLLFIASIVVLVGMWLERFVIIVSSLAQDFVPSSWGVFQATRWDWATYVGTIGLFLFLFFLFIRLLPMISIFEVRTLLPQAKVRRRRRVEASDLRSDGRVRQPTALVNAARAARAKGYRKLDAYSPFPIEELDRRAAPAQEQAAADCADRRHHRRADRLPDAVLRHGDLFPDQHRRAAAA